MEGSRGWRGVGVEGEGSMGWRGVGGGGEMGAEREGE